jgi:hypothetical protein
MQTALIDIDAATATGEMKSGTSAGLMSFPHRKPET